MIRVEYDNDVVSEHPNKLDAEIAIMDAVIDGQRMVIQVTDTETNKTLFCDWDLTLREE